MCFFLIHPTHDSGSALIDVSHEFSLRASILISAAASQPLRRSQEFPPMPDQQLRLIIAISARDSFSRARLRRSL
jgi:hypothetical protein